MLREIDQPIKMNRDLWRVSFGNLLQKQERRIASKFRSYLKEEYNKAIDQAIERQSMQSLDPLFKENDLKNLYIDLYRTIGTRFALWYEEAYKNMIQKNGNRDTWSETFAAVGEREAGRKIKIVQGTAKDEIRRVLGSLFKDPDFRSQGSVVQGRILRNQYNKISQYQAERIVRTEATNAANQGVLKGATDFFGANALEKEWIASLDERTRGSHRSVDGQKVPYNEPFKVPSKFGVDLMMHPADPNGSAANVINCRCSMALIPKEDAMLQEGVELQGFGGGLAAQATEIVGNELVAAAKPAKEVVEEVSVNIDKMKEAEVLDFIKDRFESNNINIGNITKGSQSVKRLKAQAKQIDSLLKEYDVSHSYNQISKVDIEFKTEGRKLGFVTRARLDEYTRSGERPEGYLKSINLGNKKSGTIREGYRFEDYNSKEYKFDRWSSFVDKENEDIAVLTHEFAHILTNSKFDMHHDFWKEFREIKTEYFTKLRSYQYDEWTQIDLGGGRMAVTKFKNVRKYDETALGKYAHTNDDEILAEAFREYKLSSNPREYAVKFGNLIDKYFKL